MAAAAAATGRVTRAVTGPGPGPLPVTVPRAHWRQAAAGLAQPTTEDGSPILAARPVSEKRSVCVRCCRQRFSYTGTVAERGSLRAGGPQLTARPEISSMRRTITKNLCLNLPIHWQQVQPVPVDYPLHSPRFESQVSICWANI